MTASQAFELIERELSSLEVKDHDGNVLPGDMTLGLVWKFIPREWEMLTHRFETKQTTPTEYAREAVAAIKKLRTILYRMRAMRRIEELREGA